MKLTLCYLFLFINFGFIRCELSEYRIGYLLRYCIVVSTPERIACDGLVSTMDKNKDGHLTDDELKSFVSENLAEVDQKEFLDRLREIIFHNHNQERNHLDQPHVPCTDAKKKLMEKPHLRDSLE
ncbi:uncharacterized protein LOC126892171 [Diabrotica virgifera virgifera]|uniref:EF-hand domain-containing protein n=1 Tax=Diabrotica virgifera virgifera TaxID=50390 RepID=A0ABM5L583_DIAVI|nr:uncharacterized protein LOC126892171 [Diabrotica virgifera virgifera]